MRKELETNIFSGSCALDIGYQSAWKPDVVQNRLKKFGQIVEFKSPEQTGYRRIGKYKVKETLAGEETIKHSKKQKLIWQQRKRFRKNGADRIRHRQKNTGIFLQMPRSNGLICYFTDCTSDNYSDYRYVKLYCWRHGEIYNPKQCQIDMSRVKDGTLWEVELKKNKKGNVEWVGAKLVRGEEEQ